MARVQRKGAIQRAGIEINVKNIAGEIGRGGYRGGAAGRSEATAITRGPCLQIPNSHRHIDRHRSGAHQRVVEAVSDCVVERIGETWPTVSELRRINKMTVARERHRPTLCRRRVGLRVHSERVGQRNVVESHGVE